MASGPDARLDLNNQSGGRQTAENPAGGFVGHPKHGPKMPESEPGGRVPHHKAHDAVDDFAPSSVVAPIDSHKIRSRLCSCNINDVSRTPAPSGRSAIPGEEPLRSSGMCDAHCRSSHPPYNAVCPI